MCHSINSKSLFVDIGVRSCAIALMVRVYLLI